MAMPKKRMSHHRSSTRRAHLALSLKGLRSCPNCQEPTLPHQVCKNCGYYKGRRVRESKAKTE